LATAGVYVGWTYVDGQFVPPIPPTPTPEELIQQCKATATNILNAISRNFEGYLSEFFDLSTKYYFKL
jgi:hypothetical protein